MRVPDGLSWKDVFDSGFRPKHVVGLERKTTECIDQEFSVLFDGSSEKFSLNPGLLTIELKADDGIRMIWHQSRVPLSMAEGKSRMERFRLLLAGHITQAGQMPVMMDERTGTLLTENHFDVVARIGDHSIHYGFDSSFRKEKPLIPHLYIFWRSPTGSSGPIRRKTVEPPAGYEWYSLDPKIDNPEPGVRRPAKDPQRGAREAMAAADSARRREKIEGVKQEVAARAKAAWPWLVALVVATVTGAVGWKRARSRK